MVSVIKPGEAYRFLPLHWISFECGRRWVASTIFGHITVERADMPPHPRAPDDPDEIPICPPSLGERVNDGLGWTGGWYWRCDAATDLDVCSMVDAEYAMDQAQCWYFDQLKSTVVEFNTDSPSKKPTRKKP